MSLYLLPERTNTDGFCLVDCIAANFDLRAADSTQNLSLEHFYDAFELRRGKNWSRDLRSVAAQVFDFAEECVSAQLSMTQRKNYTYSHMESLEQDNQNRVEFAVYARY